MEKKALRDAYGEGLAELGGEYENLFVLDADLTKSTKTEVFKKKYPERFINCGIAEGNMMSVASGLASCGNIVFASTFAMFAAGRAYEQIRNSIAYPRTNVKIVATHAGLTVGEDGATHQCLEDMALMRAIPGMTVISPSDAVQTKAALRYACQTQGPVYIRLGRLAVPVVHKEDYVFTPGSYVKIAEGTDMTILYTGPFYQTAIDVKALYEAKGISVKILDVPSIKPMAVDAVKEAAKTGFIVTIEDHNNIGGFGSAVCETLASLPKEYPSPKVLRLGADDRFGTSGTPEAILQEYGLDAASVALKIAQAAYPELINEFTNR